MAAFVTVIIVAVWRLDRAALLNASMSCFCLLTNMSPIDISDFWITLYYHYLIFYASCFNLFFVRLKNLKQRNTLHCHDPSKLTICDLIYLVQMKEATYIPSTAMNGYEPDFRPMRSCSYRVGLQHAPMSHKNISRLEEEKRDAIRWTTSVTYSAFESLRKP